MSFFLGTLLFRHPSQNPGWKQLALEKRTMLEQSGESPPYGSLFEGTCFLVVLKGKQKPKPISGGQDLRKDTPTWGLV